MLSRRYVITSFASAAFVLATSGVMAAEQVKAVASFSIIGDLVKQIGGDRIALTTLVGPDGDAHVFSPSTADARSVTEAKLVFVNGLGFEGWMDRLVESSGSKAALVTVSKGVEPISSEEGEGHDHAEESKHEHGHGHEHTEKSSHDHDHGHSHDHHHDGLDPHAWQAVPNAKIYAANIRDALIAADPDGKETYKANASAYLAKLDALDAEVKAAIGALPQNGRTIITSHDAFGYFAKAYGIEVIAPQGVSTDAEPTAKQVAALIRQIKAENVKAIFVENITDQRLITRIAEESGAKLGGALYSDALSPPDGPAGTYIDMIRHNIKTLSAGLSS